MCAIIDVLYKFSVFYCVHVNSHSYHCENNTVKPQPIVVGVGKIVVTSGANLVVTLGDNWSNFTKICKNLQFLLFGV